LVIYNHMHNYKVTLVSEQDTVPVINFSECLFYWKLFKKVKSNKLYSSKHIWFGAYVYGGG